MTTDEAWLHMASMWDRPLVDEFTGMHLSNDRFVGICHQIQYLAMNCYIELAQESYMRRCLVWHAPRPLDTEFRWDNDSHTAQQRAAFCRTMASSIHGVGPIPYWYSVISF